MMHKLAYKQATFLSKLKSREHLNLENYFSLPLLSRANELFRSPKGVATLRIAATPFATNRHARGRKRRATRVVAFTTRPGATAALVTSVPSEYH